MLTKNSGKKENRLLNHKLSYMDITNIDVKETLFIPAEKRFKDRDVKNYWHRVGPMTYHFEGYSHYTEIILVRCKKAENISYAFEKEIELTREKIKERPNDRKFLESQIKHFEQLKKEIKNPVYRKELPENILQHISIKGRFHPPLTQEDIVLIKGVSPYWVFNM